MEDLESSLLVGVDVGTGAVRCGVFDGHGARLSYATRDIRTWEYDGVFFEQSSEDIWRAVCEAVRHACAAVRADRVSALCFDATCSLVVLGQHDRPLSVSRSGNAQRNVVLWMDHRARGEAARLNARRQACAAVRDALRHYGGVISPENEVPKLMWLKEHMSATYHDARRFFDLADFLTYRATGDDTRGVCTTACKWARSRADGWPWAFFRDAGLGDLDERRIGERFARPGEAIPSRLSSSAAEELGLRTDVVVASGLVDAHAGGVGLLGMGGDEAFDAFPISQRLAIISGTSTCHLVMSSWAVFVDGVWGPFRDALLPGYWLAEGGQSATGALLQHVIDAHARAPELYERASAARCSVHEVLERHIATLPPDAAAEVHVLPDFHGNRSPRADPTLRGMISGLRLSGEVDELARHYLAALEAIVYGTRHVIDALRAAGHKVKVLLLAGGGAQNERFVRTLADATQLSVAVPQESEAVLLGDAVAAAAAYASAGTRAEAPSPLRQKMADMSAVARTVQPDAARRRYHEAKYAVFLRMHDDFVAYREIMSSAAPPSEEPDGSDAQ